MSVYAHAHLLLEGGRCVVPVGLQSWKTATEQSTSGARRHWSLGSPSSEGAGRKAHCSSERVVGVRVLTLLLSQFDTVFGFLFLFSFSFFLRRSRRVKSSPSPPQSNGNMKPFVLLSCPSCVHLLLPLPPTPPPCCLSPLCVFEPTFRQLRHSSV